MLVEGDRMVRCVACCRVDNQFGLLVREGVLQKSSPWSSQWSLQPDIQWLALADHALQCAALWKSVDHNVIEALH